MIIVNPIMFFLKMIKKNENMVVLNCVQNYIIFILYITHFFVVQKIISYLLNINIYQENLYIILKYSYYLISNYLYIMNIKYFNNNEHNLIYVSYQIFIIHNHDRIFTTYLYNIYSIYFTFIYLYSFHSLHQHISLNLCHFISILILSISFVYNTYFKWVHHEYEYNSCYEIFLHCLLQLMHYVYLLFFVDYIYLTFFDDPIHDYILLLIIYINHHYIPLIHINPLQYISMHLFCLSLIYIYLYYPVSCYFVVFTLQIISYHWIYHSFHVL